MARERFGKSKQQPSSECSTEDVYPGTRKYEQRHKTELRPLLRSDLEQF